MNPAAVHPRRDATPRPTPSHVAPAQVAPRPAGVVALLAIVFCSGACALVYQATWFRELRLLFGGSTQATAAVLAIFMGGLGLGGALLGRVADRHPRPLRLYAWLELGIALAALTTPVLGALAGRMYVALGGTQALGATLGTLARLLLAALVLGGPAVLMGGTLPAVARVVGRTADVGRRTVALAYGVNTLGAVAGTLIATFVLLERLGARGTLFAAAGANLALALAAFALARLKTGCEPGLALAAPPPHPTAATARGVHAERPLILAVAGVAGFVFFVMELVWYRLLGPLLGGTTFTFGVILAVALLGTGLGAAAYGFAERRRGATLALLAATCALEALALAVPFALGDRLAVLALLVRGFESLGFAALVFGWTFVAACVVLPASLVAGFQFPVLLALLGHGRSRAGSDTGELYAANTFGAIAGSLAGGFGLLPLLTAPGAWRLAAVLLAALSVCVLALSVRRESTRSRIQFASIAGIMLAMVLVSRSAGPTSAWRHSSIGAGRQERAGFSNPNDLVRFLHEYRENLVWEADGSESAVGALADDGLSLIVGGKSDGNSVHDAGTQVMLGLLGALLHPNPRQALVVGLGTGSSAGWLASVPSMRRVDVVELEPAVLNVARLCSSVNRDVLSNPRVRIRIGDGRDYLRTTRERYDLIASEPSNPYRAGVGSLFTVEFYRAARHRLAPGGVFVQWVQTYESDVATLRTAYATMGSVFPNIETWTTLTGDLVLVGSAAPLEQDIASLRRRIAEEPYRSALRDAWRTTTLEGVAAHYVGNARFAEFFGRATQANTDDNMLLEYRFARHVGRNSTFDEDDLHGVALAIGAGAPPWSGAPLDSRSIVNQRLSSCAAQGLSPPRPAPGLGFEARVAFVQAFISGNAAVARQMLGDLRGEVYDFTTLAMLGVVLADAGDSTVLPAIEALRAYRPAEADFATALLRVRRGEIPQAADAYVRACEELRRDPWAWPLLVARGLRLGPEIARADSSGRIAARAFEALATPFAGYLADAQRLKLHVELAQQLDGARPGVFTRAALAAYREDAVPWDAPVLSARAECYANLGDPRAERAAADLRRFRANSEPDLASQIEVGRLQQ